jgi:hypothetical protein
VIVHVSPALGQPYLLILTIEQLVHQTLAIQLKDALEAQGYLVRIMSRYFTPEKNFYNTLYWEYT